ncbi:MAG: low molecular weight protein-tyrosine phosphatase [Clostridiales bacterium]|nr:low molecular weight protein-tyrosine phosphatase [Clostridiales bacterium]
MAEFVFRDMIQKRGLENEILVASAATSTEEIGNPVHPGTRRILKGIGISCEGKRAIQLKRSDYQTYDYILGMDAYNVKNILRLVGSDQENKVERLLAIAGEQRDIADPWYTGDFEKTYRDVKLGLEALLTKIVEKYHLE